MVRSYICIGGPLDGQVKYLDHGVRTLHVPVRQDFKFWNEGYAPGIIKPAVEEYRVQGVVISQSIHTPEVHLGHARARINIDFTVDVLVHESILTVEEVAARYRKQQSGTLRYVVQNALAQIQLGRE